MPRVSVAGLETMVRCNLATSKDAAFITQEAQDNQGSPNPAMGTIREGNDEIWRQHVRQKMEEELEKRVREALDTPPLERQRRIREQVYRSRIADCDELNAHLDLVEANRESASARQQRLRLLQSREIDSRLHFRRLLESRSGNELAASMGLQSPFGNGLDSGLRSFADRMISVGLGQNNKEMCDPDNMGYDFGDAGSLSIKCGIALPSGVRLLLPPPEFISAVPFAPEPLSSGQEGPDLFDGQPTPYTHKWRGICIVFDSEKWPKDQQPSLMTNPLIAPSLIFESRFESGNLRQARRVGQFEYELLLKTDLYTKRHTQWYYFRLQNMVPSAIYKFRIVNFLKKDSLYNYGMKPLFYSETDAKTKGVGWIRKGHHIRYDLNVDHLASPLLSRELNHYELEWQMEFSSAGDTCYVAHCYPYTFTDLKSDLDAIMEDPRRNGVTKREVMCETKAGNSCFLITVTNFDVKTTKKCVVVSARVHPGETNASWMMKGLLDFITGPDAIAEELRRKFVFKVIPMINPDGVIIGNYRCGLAGKDLNRNYRHPRHESFPTVSSTKNMIIQMQSKMEVLIYCDLHGHSRKSNVFMYGCNSPESIAGDVKAFLEERVFPFLVAKHAPGTFAFSSCKFQIKKCKESTGRVVMYKQLKIKNSFTLEATFSGTLIDKSGSRHFNQKDFQEVGKTFCLGVHEYSQVLENKQKESEVLLELAKEIAHQILKLKGFVQFSNQDEVPEESTSNHLHNADEPTTCTMSLEPCNSLSADVYAVHQNNAENNASVPASVAPVNAADAPTEQEVQQGSAGDASACQRRHLEASASSEAKAVPSAMATEGNSEQEREKILAIFNSMSQSTIQECLGLLGDLNFALEKLESDSSSDSDSESDPEVAEVKHKAKKKKKRSKKHKDKKSKTKSSSAGRRRSLPLPPAQASWEESAPTSAIAPIEPVSRPFVLPTIGPTASDKDEGLSAQERESQKTMEKYVKLVKSYQWVNPYSGRSNGGIPCFSEERSLERAAKRMNDLRKKSEGGEQLSRSGSMIWKDNSGEESHEERRLEFADFEGSARARNGLDMDDDDYYQQWLSHHFERERTQELLRWSLQTLADGYTPRVSYQHAGGDGSYPKSRGSGFTTQDGGVYPHVLPPSPRHSVIGLSASEHSYADWDVAPLACSLITLSALHSPYASDGLALLPVSSNVYPEEDSRKFCHGERSEAQSTGDILGMVGLQRHIVPPPQTVTGSAAGASQTRKPSWRLRYAAAPSSNTAAAADGISLAAEQRLRSGGANGSTGHLVHATSESSLRPRLHGENTTKEKEILALSGSLRFNESGFKSHITTGSRGTNNAYLKDASHSLPPVPSRQSSKMLSRDYTETLAVRLKQQQMMAAEPSNKNGLTRITSRQT